MTPDGMLESINPAGRIDRALDMLRAHLVERTVQSHWDEDNAHEVACKHTGTTPGAFRAASKRSHGAFVATAGAMRANGTRSLA